VLRRLSVLLFWSILWLALSFWVNTFYFLWRHTPPLKPHEASVETPREAISSVLNRPTFKVAERGDLWIQGFSEPYAVLPVSITNIPGISGYLFVLDVRQWQSAGFLFRVPILPGGHKDILIEPRSPPCATAKPTEVCLAGSGKDGSRLRFPVALARSENRIFALELSGSPMLWETDLSAGSLKPVPVRPEDTATSEFKSILPWHGGWAIADRGTGTVRIYSDRWVPLSRITRDTPAGKFAPNALAADPDGNLVVADAQSGIISIFSPQGTLLRDFGGYSAQQEGKFLRPTGIAASSDGTLFISDTYRNIINVFNSQGQYLGAIRSTDFKRKPMVQPRGIALSSDGATLYIAGGKRGEGGFVWLLPLPQDDHA
jgi:hypothetical protein